MMASGEIRLSSMTMRRMPVLAQSQNSTQSPFPAGCDANCQALQVTVTTSQSSYLSYPALYNPNFFVESGESRCVGCGSVGTSTSSFVKAAGALVASTTAIGAGTGALYAYGELATVTTTGVGVDFGGSILLATGAFSDVGGMAIVGSSLGAAAGVATLPAFGIGWAIGTALNPYVQPIISSWYGY